MDFILIAGILTAILILLLAPKREQRELPRKILLLLFTVFLFVTLNLYAALHDILWLEVLGFLLENGARLSTGPLLLLYVHALFREPRHLVRNQIWHFVPFLLHTCLVTLPVLASVLMGEAIFAYLPALLDLHVMALLQALYLIFYCAYALMVLARYSGKAQQVVARPLDDEQHFVRNLLLGVIVVAMIDLVTSVYESYFEDLDWDTGLLTVSALVVLMIYLAYYGVRQSRVLIPDFILADHPRTTKQEQTETIVRKPYSLIEEDSIGVQLEQVMLEKRAFMDEDLTLTKLSKQVGTSDKKLSFYLNSVLGLSFYEYVNGFRIEEVKAVLTSGEKDHLTIFAIALDSGFKSKSTFNRLFKKKTGMSPSAYRDRVNNTDLG